MLKGSPAGGRTSTADSTFPCREKSSSRAKGFSTPDTALTVREPLPPDRQPARVYLAQLHPGSRRTMAEALEVIARTITKGRTGAEHLAWHALRYQHVL